MTQGAKGVVVAGHGVASGRASDSPFAAGTIELQAPHFRARGLDRTHVRRCLHYGVVTIASP